MPTGTNCEEKVWKACFALKHLGPAFCALPTATTIVADKLTSVRLKGCTLPAMVPSVIRTVFYRIIGRVDDVINVSGHRMGTAEVENAINEHPKVVESAVVGFPHDIKGQGIYAYLICEGDIDDEAAFTAEVLQIVNREIGPHCQAR